jgi:hypothetical protein
LVYVHVTRVRSFPPKETDRKERKDSKRKENVKLRIVLNMQLATVVSKHLQPLFHAAKEKAQPMPLTHVQTRQ